MRMTPGEAAIIAGLITLGGVFLAGLFALLRQTGNGKTNGLESRFHHLEEQANRIHQQAQDSTALVAAKLDFIGSKVDKVATILDERLPKGGFKQP
jgi:hypothetical protein